MRTYQICQNCVMDTSDTRIVFDESGVCDHCVGFRNDVAPSWDPAAGDRPALERLAIKIKKAGEGRDFDCILGMSGGLDSSYMAHVAVREMELRPLVFHVDGGWDSDTAVKNIERILEKLGLDLYTEVINWEEMKDLQLAYFKSGVPHIDHPQDHAFIAALYDFALKHDVRYILNGSNLSTECVQNPMEFFYYGTDMRQVRDIRRQFGTNDMATYPWSGVLRHKVYLRYFRRIQVAKPLNLVPYLRSETIAMLGDEYGWEWYGQKHFESRFTKFYEGYWLPERFGFDTRRVQFSSLILTGQMTRDDALERLETPAYDPETIELDFEYVANKLGITVDELRGYFELPLKWYHDYRNSEQMFQLGAKVLKRLGAYRTVRR